MEINKVIQGDCLEILRSMPDKSVDLILTDPPYGIQAGGLLKESYKIGSRTELANRTDYGHSDWDDFTPSKEYFDEMIRVSKRQVIFGGQYFADKLPPRGRWIIWDKKVEEKYQNDFSDCELAWTSENGSTKIIRYLWNGMLQGNMANKEKRQHPTQKPVEMIGQILAMFSEEGDTVMDPFSGSGSTAVSCVRLKRNYIAVEINPEYCKVAESRLRQPVLL